jgi:hypothetical protein
MTGDWFWYEWGFYRFYNGGLLFSSVTFVFIAIISLYSFLLLVKTKVVVSGSFGGIITTSRSPSRVDSQFLRYRRKSLWSYDALSYSWLNSLIPDRVCSGIHNFCVPESSGGSLPLVYLLYLPLSPGIRHGYHSLFKVHSDSILYPHPTDNLPSSCPCAGHCEAKLRGSYRRCFHLGWVNLHLWKRV